MPSVSCHITHWTPTPVHSCYWCIYLQAAFLSALVGVDVAEVASHAAVKALCDLSEGRIKEHLKSLSAGTDNQGMWGRI